MISVKWHVFFCVIVATLISCGIGQELDNGEFIEEELLQNSVIEEAIGEQCDQGACGRTCDCCPGYGISTKQILFFKKSSCKKCDCGKTFGCVFDNWRGRKTCHCPTGYSQESNTCKADCKNNPSIHGGVCTVNANDIVCECKEPYFGEICEKNKCSYINCLNNGTCVIKNGNATCDCTEEYTDDFCETNKCSQIKCHNEGKCVIKEGRAICNCTDEYTGEFCERQLSTYPPITSTTEQAKSSTDAKTDTSLATTTPTTRTNSKSTSRLTNTKTTMSTTELVTDKSTFSTTESFGNGTSYTTSDITNFTNEIIRITTLTRSEEETTTTTTPGKPCDQGICRGTCNCCPGHGFRLSGVFRRQSCKKCDCGKTFGCSFDNWTRKKTCQCPTGYTEISNTCKELSTYPPSTSTTEKTKSSTDAKTDISLATTTPTTRTNSKSTSRLTNTKTTLSTTEFVTESNTMSTTEVVTYNNNLSSTELVTDNITLSSTELVTDKSTFSTTESFGNGTSYSTSDITNFTTEIIRITTLTTSEEETTTTTTSADNVCKTTICRNGGTCMKDNGVEKCVCRYPFGGEICEDNYWCTGIGKELCNGQNCTFDNSTRIGRCVCLNGQYFDYSKRTCQNIDKCPLMPGKCTINNEECRNNKCQCKDNFKRNNKNECVPNFCAKLAETVCKSNTECVENVKHPENVICQCKSGYVYNGEECVKVNKCQIPGILGCQQTCDLENENCKCFSGYELQEDMKSCKLKTESFHCSKNCNPGVCYENGKEEICICPVTHVYLNETCKDLCTARLLPSNLCPGDLCEAHSDLGFRCKCNGKWTYDFNQVTCRRKLMCSEGDGIEICANKSAKCIEDEKFGFKCICPETEEMDEDGTCKKKCELKKYQDNCRARLAECDMQGSEVICKCPTLLTFNNEGVCTELATSFSGEIPFYKNMYVSPTLFAPGGNVSVPNYEKMKHDFRNAMQLVYGTNYQFADIRSCIDMESILSCSVEIQFKSDPKDQYKLLGSPETCIPGESNTCLIPPKLVLLKKGVNINLLSKTDPCTESIKYINCGGNETICRNTTPDKKNFECTCAEGFKSYSTIYPVSDRRTVIHKCTDINECLLPRACPNRTRCLNTYGTYECLCNEGFKPVNGSSSPKSSGCVAVCSPDVCGNGVCKVDGFYYSCSCNEGYSGPDCKQKLERPDVAKEAEVALIAMSAVVVPLALLSAYVIRKNKKLNKRLQKENDLDDSSSTISMQPLITAQM